MCWTEVTELVRAAQAGDRSAYGELVKRFQASVYAMALSRVRDPLEAEELAQDVLVHGMRKLPQLRDPRCFAGWLRQITARMAINRKARRGLVCGDPDILETVAGATNEPIDHLARTETKSELHASLRQLKPLDRATLETFYLRGRSLKQMSREFETPVGTIKRRLHVARQRLKDVMEGVTAELPAPKRRKRELCGV